MAFKWSDDFSVGVDLIDEQHKGLFRATDKLVDAMGAGGGEEDLPALVSFLEQYTAEHFRAEEEYMEAHNYPGYMSHKQEHESFIQDVGEWKARLEKEGPNALMVIQTQKWLYDWLKGHIKGMDKKMADYLRPKIGER